MTTQIEKNCRFTLSLFIGRFPNAIYDYLINSDELVYLIYDVKEDNKCNDLQALLIMNNLGCFDFHKDKNLTYRKLKRKQEKMIW